MASSSAPAWKQYPFFTTSAPKDLHDENASPGVFKTAAEISTLASSTSGVLVADIHGSVHLLNRKYESVTSWIAHVSGRVTHMMTHDNVLVTLGEEQSSRAPLIKVWNLKKVDTTTGAPTLLRSVKVQQGNKPHPVTAAALSKSLSYLAVGLGDGTVLLYRHLDQSIFSTSSSLTTLPKPRVVHESPTEPVTGLGVREASVDEDAATTTAAHLFIVTTARVLSYRISGKGASNPTVIDEVGCALNCATMDWIGRDIIVAREEALYVCGIEGRGNCLAYEGPKALVHTHRNYLVIISPPFTPSATSASSTIRRLVSRGDVKNNVELTKVTVFDIENKIVAHSDSVSEGVLQVLSHGNSVLLVTTSGKLIQFDELPMPQKLSILFESDLYSMAIKIALTQSLDDGAMADIYRQYGDHLYGKGDFDGAMQHYLKTIGHVRPSYVIRKFLDAQRIHNLTTYLQQLHSLGLANADHTTLLLNTYTKLKDVTRLDNFIKTESRRSVNSDDPDALPFDLDTAIRVCRQAGYFDHASYLAKKYDRHEDYLRIQIEDSSNYQDALDYLRKQEPATAERNLTRYGQILLSRLPEETTRLFIELCSGMPTVTEESQTSTIKASNNAPSYLSYLALNKATAVLGGSSEAPRPSTPQSANAATTDATHSRKNTKQGPVMHSPDPGTPIQPPKPPPPKVDRPSPRPFFAHFVDHMDHFLVFLEAVALQRWGQSVEENSTTDVASVERPQPKDEVTDSRDQTAVWNTLLELYVTLAGPPDSTELAAFALREKALRVIRNESLPYDSTHALILCSTRGFTSGMVLLWERMGMYEDVLRFWMDGAKDGGESAEDASKQVIRCVGQYGGEHPHLYPLVLRFLTTSPAMLSRHMADVTKVLEHIENEKIMSPLQVIQLLGRSDVASIGLVKDWLLTRIQEANDEIQTDKQLIESYRQESAAKLQQVKDLSNPEEPHVFHVTRCSTCGGQLDLPSVHFMCNHSYHQRCLSGNETECPNCARSHGMIRELRETNERLADQHDLFCGQVAEGGFAAVAAGFGRGLLDMTRLEDAAA